MIETIVRNHPLKDIVLDFDDAISPPDFEQEALALYYKAHDLTWTIVLEVAERMPRLREVHDMLDDLLLRSLAIEQELDFLEEAFGISIMSDIGYFEGEVLIDFDEFFAKVMAHNVDFDQAYRIVDEMINIYNEDLKKIVEEDYLIDPSYFTNLDPLYDRYEELSVHTVSLDKDYQLFLGKYGEMEKGFFAYTDFATVVFQKYKHFSADIDKLYRRVEVVHETIRTKLDEERRKFDAPDE